MNFFSFHLCAHSTISSITIRRAANHNGFMNRITDCVKLNPCILFLLDINCVPRGNISVI